MVPIIYIFVALNKIGAINLFGPLFLLPPNLNHMERFPKNSPRWSTLSMGDRTFWPQMEDILGGVNKKLSKYRFISNFVPAFLQHFHTAYMYVHVLFCFHFFTFCHTLGRFEPWTSEWETGDATLLTNQKAARNDVFWLVNKLCIVVVSSSRQ